MKSLFVDEKIKTDEDYKKHLKGKILLFYVLIFLGLGAILVSLMAKSIFNISLETEILCFYNGMGIGLIIPGIIGIIKFKSLLKNKDKLREDRIKYTDERNQKISLQAGKISLMALIIAIYGIMVVGGLFNKEIIKLMMIIIGVFFITYGVSYKVLEKKL
ncbi:hypothetical protein [Miniphocaeibacter massiliensis]|uniref:hypothetical protein n=1 Tax=Miniphocaeibacter massiliensis TaxID=2041841 RepID=UPI000C1BEC8A|nr:hypothetical protein [Miniphocaeibacter massiliensis]